MSLYQALQLSPLVLKQHLKHAKNYKETAYIYGVLTLRSTLLIAFAILFIAGLNYYFDEANSSVAVSLFCILLGIRFVPYGYNIKHSLGAMTFSFILMAASSYINSLKQPLLYFFINLIFLLLILILTADEPIMGNAGIYVFSYLFISNTPVNGHLMHLRLLELGLGLIICGTIMVAKHRQKDPQRQVQTLFQNFTLKDAKCRWQVRLALGVSLGLFLGQLWHLPRVVWLGYACMSVLLPNSDEIRGRVWLRIGGVICGSLLFGLIYKQLPSALTLLIGPMAGFLIGYTATYFLTTVLNCFGGLMLATTIYGVDHSILFRIQNNFIGAVFAAAFCLIFNLVHRFIANRHKTSLNP
ncbi:FUSC family protein [Agrilactobacillus yilanensis]|uniref:FUSC family protein n=1 Tax=Agrilactobacillus yilanensis TaxID=2485997 RepID=A0ABW4JAK3_9LACO|nr:FUSC family protein [Agrilactobacillus yilanensis]